MYRLPDAADADQEAAEVPTGAAAAPDTAGEAWQMLQLGSRSARWQQQVGSDSAHST